MFVLTGRSLDVYQEDGNQEFQDFAQYLAHLFLVVFLFCVETVDLEKSLSYLSPSGKIQASTPCLLENKQATYQVGCSTCLFHPCQSDWSMSVRSKQDSKTR